MKQFLKFSGLIALGLALVGFILFMATPAITYEGETAASGADVLFGRSTILVDIKPSALALIAWILILVALLALAFMSIMMFAKKDFYEKIGNLFAIIIAIAFILAAVFSFFTVPTYFSANGVDSVPDGYVLGVGWIIGAILVILAGGLSLLPVIMKKK